LHFGSGQLAFDETARRFSHSLVRENNRIALPGSSFKGMLRSLFEAVTASCILNAPRALPMMTGALSSCTESSGLCPACSVFGRLSYKGKLTFSSFYTDAEPVIMRIPQLEQPFKTYPRPAKGDRDPRTGNERLYYGNFSDVRGIDVASMSKSEFLSKVKREPYSTGRFYGRKFYKHSENRKKMVFSSGMGNYECLPVATALSGHITYQGLAEDELGALLFALGFGWGSPIFHKLGYAKPAFFGSVKLAATHEPLQRYGGKPMSNTDAVNIASRYYTKNKALIATAVAALKQEWSQIGDSMWVLNDGRYGY
jgi:hypothetical protein